MNGELRLSQCMIVKNEAHNIRRALSWGKDMVWEQIIVDTGSDDDTIAIAEEIGAKVFHYAWEDDFSAAKNYAISKASGDWIAFLDADEYIRQEDMAALQKVLEQLSALPPDRQPDLIRCNLLNIDGEGAVLSSAKQNRFFKNNGKILYKNKIHEMLHHTSGKTLHIYDADDTLCIYHTGYSADAIRDKAERNLKILKREATEHPKRYELWAYIGDAFLAEKKYPEALDAYQKIIAHPEAEMNINLRLQAYAKTARFFRTVPNFTEEKNQALYDQYQKIGVIYPDMEYWMGINCLYFQKKRECAAYLEKALEALETVTLSFGLYITGDLENVYGILALIYTKEDAAKAVRYAVLSLRINRFQEDILTALLGLLRSGGETPENIYIFLGKIYDLKAKKDLLFVYKAVKILGFTLLEECFHL